MYYHSKGHELNRTILVKRSQIPLPSHLRAPGCIVDYEEIIEEASGRVSWTVGAERRTPPLFWRQ
jgi:hypothetical protein